GCASGGGGSSREGGCIEADCGRWVSSLSCLFEFGRVSENLFNRKNRTCFGSRCGSLVQRRCLMAGPLGVRSAWGARCARGVAGELDDSTLGGRAAGWLVRSRSGGSLSSLWSRLGWVFLSGRLLSWGLGLLFGRSLRCCWL